MVVYIYTFGVLIQKLFFWTCTPKPFLEYFKLKGSMPSVVAHKYCPRP